MEDTYIRMTVLPAYAGMIPDWITVVTAVIKCSPRMRG